MSVLPNFLLKVGRFSNIFIRFWTKNNNEFAGFPEKTNRNSVKMDLGSLKILKENSQNYMRKYSRNCILYNKLQNNGNKTNYSVI